MNDDWIVFAHAETVATGSTSWATSYPELVAYNQESAEELLIDNGGDQWAGTKPFAFGADDTLFFGVDWSMDENGLAVADLRTSVVETVLKDQDVRELYADGDRPYWYVPLRPRGGSLRTIGANGAMEILETNEFNCCDMIGVEDDEIFFFRGDGDRIDALSPNGASRVVAEGVDMDYPTALSAENVYWARSAELYFARRDGSAPQRISRTDTGWIEGVDANECAVFWSVLNPPRIMVRARP